MAEKTSFVLFNHATGYIKQGLAGFYSVSVHNYFAAKSAVYLAVAIMKLGFIKLGDCS